MRSRRVPPRTAQAAEPGRLRASAGQGTGPISIGIQPLGLEAGRDGMLYVPTGYQTDHPAPLALMLHGAGGDAQGGLFALVDLADEANLLLLAPESRRRTWDMLMDGYGPDVAFIDRAVAQTFSRYTVDPARLAIGGFSDGASYALSLGIANGDLFSHILAFSPGFIAPPGQEGTPRIFVSHGTRDQVLPIDACSRRIVPALQRAGYEIRYREFDGGHTVPPEISRDALAWFRH
jgi:phospholipase/carboxylesterase